MMGDDKGLKSASMLDINLLKEWLNYCPISGHITWKKPTSRMKAGDIAGRKKHDGYISINFKGKQMLAHRIAWAISFGEDPKLFIDHINNDRADNRLSNLRLANRNENNRNCLLRKDNKTGVKGVHFCKRDNLYVAQIRVDGKPKRLGSFKYIEDAIKIRKNAELNLYGEFINNGQ